LLQTKQFASSDNAELFAEEVEREVSNQKQSERQRQEAVPGLIPQSELPAQAEDMADA
jgi:exportin-1